MTLFSMTDDGWLLIVGGTVASYDVATCRVLLCCVITHMRTTCVYDLFMTNFDFKCKWKCFRDKLLTQFEFDWAFFTGPYKLFDWARGGYLTGRACGGYLSATSHGWFLALIGVMRSPTSIDGSEGERERVRSQWESSWLVSQCKSGTKITIREGGRVWSNSDLPRARGLGRSSPWPRRWCGPTRACGTRNPRSCSQKSAPEGRRQGVNVSCVKVVEY